MNATAAANAPALVSNPANIRADWGPATYDVRNAGVMNVTYDLPFGNGKQMLNGVSGWENNVVGGWTVNSIVTIQSGFPFTPQLSFNPSNDGDSKNPVRPSWNPAFTGPVILGGTTQWFNPEAFSVPAQGTFGNVGRNVLDRPRTRNLGFFSSEGYASIRTDESSVPRGDFQSFEQNEPEYTQLIVFTSATATPAQASPVAGTFTGTSTFSRQVQFSLKLLW